MTEYPIPTPDAFAADIAPGPDGALWFTESNANKVGRITTAGVITEFTLPAAESLPGPIVAGADGAIYFGERNANKIGRMTTDGVLTNEFAIPTENANPLALVAAPDGNLYFTQHEDGTVARMSLDGTFTKKFRIPSGYPDGLAVDSSGDLWFTQGNFGQVGRIDLRWDPPLSAAGTTFTARRHVSAERTVATFTDPDTDARPSDYDVTIKWGDGSTTAGWVRRAGAGLEVRGRHTYDKAKTFAVTVKIDKTKVYSTAIVTKQPGAGRGRSGPRLDHVALQLPVLAVELHHLGRRRAGGARRSRRRCQVGGEEPARLAQAAREKGASVLVLEKARREWAACLRPDGRSRVGPPRGGATGAQCAMTRGRGAGAVRAGAGSGAGSGLRCGRASGVSWSISRTSAAQTPIAATTTSTSTRLISHQLAYAMNRPSTMTTATMAIVMMNMRPSPPAGSWVRGSGVMAPPYARRGRPGSGSSRDPCPYSSARRAGSFPEACGRWCSIRCCGSRSGRGPYPGRGSCCSRSTPAASAAPTCTCSTAR